MSVEKMSDHKPEHAEAKAKKRRKASGEPAPAQEHPAQKVGEMLRQARLDKKMTLDAVSSAINVRVIQLKAIEEGHIDQLPGMTYALGFVKSYAAHLKLDGAEIANRFKAEHSSTPAKPELHFPEPLAESKMPDPLIIGGAAVAVVVLLAAWAVFSGHDDRPVATAVNIPPPPAASAALLTQGNPIPGAGDTSALTSDVTKPAVVPAANSAIATGPLTAPLTPLAQATGAAGAQAPAPQGEKSTADAASQPQAKTAGDATALQVHIAEQTPTPPVEAQEGDAHTEQAVVVAPAAPRAERASAHEGGNENVINVRRGRSRITLKANSSTWVQISDAAQATVFKKVMRPGDEYFVPDQKGLTMVTSNAGGLEVYVDGKRVQTLGKQGEIIRGIELDPAELKIKRIKTRD